MSGSFLIHPADDMKALVGRQLSRWWAFLWGAYGDQEEIASAEAVTASETAVRIGQLPESVDQQSLYECASITV
jgi:hypothetical protein